MPRFRIFVLGAGFSKPAGLPLGYELWPEIRARVGRLGDVKGHFEDDLQDYIRFKRECDGRDLSPEEVDFEEFMAFLDLEYFLGLRGSDTWSDDGNETQVIIKTLIAETLVEATPAASELPAVYSAFAEALEPGDYVLTFNYDVILERALEAAGRPFRLFPDRYERILTSGTGIVDSSREREEVAILKLHGSVDWFDKGSYMRLSETFREQGSKTEPKHPVFGPESQVRASPLLEGPQSPNDPLQNMHRVLDVDTLYETPVLFNATPWLLSPSTAKVIYARKLRSFWWGLGQAGGLNFGVAIIGYSLPEHDDYARQALFRMVKNYQESWWDEGFPGGLRKSPVLLIDKKPTPERAKIYREHYGFIDPKKAKYHLTGFDEEAVALIREVSKQTGPKRNGS